MRRIRKTDTKPELRVRRLAHALGYRFRLHRRDLPGTPDLVFPRLAKVLLVHGCFWHQHPGCRLARLPKAGRTTGCRSFAAIRSATRPRLLRSAPGWSVLVVWECQTASNEAVAEIIRRFLEDGRREPPTPPPAAAAYPLAVLSSPSASPEAGLRPDDRHGCR